ncbi:hypothetical protein SAMN05446935_6690 [Burkholderia sp. YR290]|jgi:hypothetical protein|nr:hypothetical protein PMI06_008055 [Burkholderia sp. BT03]SEH95165.1 hypothetical protein SAMN05192544_1013100 [Paraburkholderia hospita]SKC88637.1 hypothetical protein SAMN05445504_5441 [Burkholderia sp. CF099]SOE86188.1 hypothetical protein SAMN05446935_6690 [Burkholderia sp. YR290]SKC72162.1 hypothetical protein SAMN06266956_2344 [Paraburkholderia hospita]
MLHCPVVDMAVYHIVLNWSDKWKRPRRKVPFAKLRAM